MRKVQRDHGFLSVKDPIPLTVVLVYVALFRRNIHAD